MHAIIIAGQIPLGPNPPAASSGIPWAWGVIAFIALGLLLRLGNHLAARPRRPRQ
jgi:hypothetical protein